MAKNILCKDCKHNQGKCEYNILVHVKNRHETIEYKELDKTECKHYDV